MINTNKLTIMAVAAVFGLTACGGGAKPAANAPANAPANKPAANAPANSSSNAAPAAKKDAPKEKLANEKKPEDVKAKTAKSNPVPANWIFVSDEVKGYGFSVPEGTTGGSQTTEGIDVFVATTPAPNEIAIFVLAYKDAKKSKEDLLNDAVKFLEGMDLKVTPGTLKGESDDYAVADCTTVAKDGTKEKQRILVGTDVTDNYVMILNTAEDKFAADEKTIDEIWGSFEMYSGGASAN